MADVLVLGAGMIGLSTAMLLAGDGHDVTVVERDPESPPDSVDDIWGNWTRRGVSQFHQGHFFTIRLFRDLARELPEVLVRAEALGARRYNQVAHGLPLTGGEPRADDADLDTLSGRRPIMEAAFAGAAVALPRVTIRRGVAIQELLSGPGPIATIPHITGVRTENGEELTADLVIDALGRRTPVPRWLEPLGVLPAIDLADIGVTYYGRHFRGRELPEMRTWLAAPYGSISTLTLPADNDVWVAGIVGQSRDAPLRALLDPDTFTRTMQSLPLVSHWIDAEPLEDHILTMTKIEDRRYEYVIDGEPLVTGLVSVGDAWACSNPSLGRGVTIGFLHALALRDALRRQDLDDLRAFALAFADETDTNVRPWYDDTKAIDLERKRVIDAELRGDGDMVEDPQADMVSAFLWAALRNTGSARDFAQIAGMIETGDDVFARPGVFERVIEYGADWADQPRNGPTRAELLQLLER